MVSKLQQPLVKKAKSTGSGSEALRLLHEGIVAHAPMTKTTSSPTLTFARWW